jgi:ABC-type multidrug transport system fused ATPase/permease subunit
MLPFFMSFIYILNKIMSTDNENPFQSDLPTINNNPTSNPFQSALPTINNNPTSNPFQSALPTINNNNPTSSSIDSLSSMTSDATSGVAGFFGSIYSMLQNASSSTLTSKINMEFLKPNLLQVPSVIFLLVILLVFIVLISYWAYIKSNWEQVKCKDGRFWIAPLFGKSTQETIKDCTTKEIQLTVNKNLQSEIERLAELDDSVSNLQALLADNESNTSSLRSDTNSTLTNITNILESNINYVKGALSTILASIYISSNLNKGALTSYADLQTSDIAEIIDKYNNVNMDEANLNFI